MSRLARVGRQDVDEMRLAEAGGGERKRGRPEIVHDCGRARSRQCERKKRSDQAEVVRCSRPAIPWTIGDDSQQYRPSAALLVRPN